MSACCDVPGDRKSATWAPRVREILAWALPSAVLVVMPKCPACLAAYVALLTGFGLSFSTAAYLRWGLLVLCISSLLFVMVNRLDRTRAIVRPFKKEIDPCNTQ